MKVRNARFASNEQRPKMKFGKLNRFSVDCLAADTNAMDLICLTVHRPQGELNFDKRHIYVSGELVVQQTGRS
ncbi:hypothetical protein AT302_26025 [Pandoraea norimbergensis]|uniref:Uncharacterized protein n=1 Tax=Pandoraea norimbergensis TaxID=93219 RepID=A0ABM5WQA5_9BURK|nr:hypothetical protein AT302_26025 [Pandoraea norimbergensis]